MRICILVSLLAFLSLGCEKSGPSPSLESTNDVLVSDGRLNFKDFKAFGDFALNLMKKDETTLKWLEEQKDFKSMTEAYYAIDFDYYSEKPVEEMLKKYSDVATIEREGRETYVVKQSSTHFESLLANHQGIFQFGDSIVKITRGTNYVFHKKYLSQLEGVENIPGCRKIQLKVSTVEPKESSTVAELRQDARFAEDEYTGTDRKDRKLKGHANLWIDWWALAGRHVFFRVESYHYKQGFLGVWWEQDTDQLTAGGSATVSLAINTSTTSPISDISLSVGPVTENDKSHACVENLTLGFSVRGEPETFNTISTSHSCRKVSASGFASCSIN
jgi:hypothetical protein